MSRSAIALLALALAAAMPAPASAQSQSEAGTLTCQLRPTIELIIGSRQRMTCVFSIANTGETRNLSGQDHAIGPRYRHQRGWPHGLAGERPWGSLAAARADRPVCRRQRRDRARRRRRRERAGRRLRQVDRASAAFARSLGRRQSGAGRRGPAACNDRRAAETCNFVASMRSARNPSGSSVLGCALCIGAASMLGGCAGLARLPAVTVAQAQKSSILDIPDARFQVNDTARINAVAQKVQQRRIAAGDGSRGRCGFW